MKLPFFRKNHSFSCKSPYEFLEEGKYFVFFSVDNTTRLILDEDGALIARCKNLAAAKKLLKQEFKFVTEIKPFKNTVREHRYNG
jgi:hypothetical protein